MRKTCNKSSLPLLGAVMLVAGFGATLWSAQLECGIHHCPMLKDTVYIRYGLIRPSEEYVKAFRGFTNANSVLLGGCILDESRSYQKTLYCPACRDGEERWLASQTGKKAAEIRLWARAASSMNATNSQGEVLIEAAARCGDTSLIKEILAKGGTVNSSDGYPLPLLIAIVNDNLPTVRLLADAGADMAAKNADGETLLHVAARRSSKEIVAALVERGADVMARNLKAQTPLDLAKQFNKDPEVSKYLRQHRTSK